MFFGKELVHAFEGALKTIFFEVGIDDMRVLIEYLNDPSQDQMAFLISSVKSDLSPLRSDLEGGIKKTNVPAAITSRVLVATGKKGTSLGL
jgi:hypothetical protein